MAIWVQNGLCLVFLAVLTYGGLQSQVFVFVDVCPHLLSREEAEQLLGHLLVELLEALLHDDRVVRMVVQKRPAILLHQLSSPPVSGPASSVLWPPPRSRCARREKQTSGRKAMSSRRLLSSDGWHVGICPQTSSNARL